MKAAVLTAIKQLTVTSHPGPEIRSADHVLLRMRRVGICGSDVHYYSWGRIGSQVVRYPFLLGHEGSAVVEAVGAAVSRVKPGDRVAVDPAVPCRDCDQCRAGRENTCRRLQFLGCPDQLDGCLSEFLVMPEECCLPVPDTVSLDEAALAEPLSIGLHAVKLSMPVPGAKIGILGLGPIGLSVMLCARGLQAGTIYGTDILDYRCRFGIRHGFDWTGNPEKIDVCEQIRHREPLLLDAVFECCGRQEALDDAVRLLKPGGRLVIVGIPQFERYSFSADQARRHEISIQNVRRQNHCTRQAIDMITDKTVDPGFMVTHRYRLEDCPGAFETVENYEDGVIKAVVDFAPGES